MLIVNEHLESIVTPGGFAEDELHPPSILTRSLRATRSSSLATGVFLRWHGLREASGRLAGLLTRAWPERVAAGQPPRLDRCLAEALAAARAAYETDGEIAERDAFVRTVADHLGESLNLTLLGKARRGWRVFDPLDAPLIDWIARHRPSVLHWVAQPHAAYGQPAAKLLCAGRVFPLSLLEAAGLLNEAPPAATQAPDHPAASP